MLVFTRPVAMRYFNVGRAKTNVDSMLGERGIVTGRIDNLHSCGQVTLKGMEWSARSQETEGTIEEGTVVIVKKKDRRREADRCSGRDRNRRTCNKQQRDC